MAYEKDAISQYPEAEQAAGDLLGTVGFLEGIRGVGVQAQASNMQEASAADNVAAVVNGIDPSVLKGLEGVRGA